MSEQAEQLAREVSREFYERYEAMAAPILDEVKWDLAVLYYCDIQRLEKLFMEDKHLNNIPMYRIDSFYNYINSTLRAQGLLRDAWHKISLAESCCIIKHILIYHVLKVKPILI